MKTTFTTRNLIILTALGATTATLTALGRYVRSEIISRGYPSWRQCQCASKTSQTVFPVLYSRHKQRGETIFSQEWGITLKRPPLWLRRFLHHSAQVLATLNPGDRYVQRGILNPQEARQFAALLQPSSSVEEDFTEPSLREHTRIAWQREVLHPPQRLFDVHIRRLYPMRASHSHDRSSQAQPLPVLWDWRSNLPLPGDRALLETPEGTRIDYIAWSPSQISFCTIRDHRPI
ncbi:MAG TPA: hypothetical protein VKR06_27135 [Ktedonosporobacter sp.]|nr:hypothetical protein [Ktedonosporobacter sp.]